MSRRINNTRSIGINPAKVVSVLAITAGVLVILSLIGQYHMMTVGEGVISYTFAPRFGLDYESSVPAYFSALLLLSVSLLLGSIALDKKGIRYGRYWALLAALFFLLSVDEATAFHEVLMTSALGNEGDLGGGGSVLWIIFGGIALIIVGIMALRFLFHLPRKDRVLFVLSGVLYVGGALGVDLVAGSYADMHGRESLTYVLMATVEESLEMAGAIVFIYALLYYKGQHGHPVQFKVVGPNEKDDTLRSAESPASPVAH